MSKKVLWSVVGLVVLAGVLVIVLTPKPDAGLPQANVMDTADGSASETMPVDTSSEVSESNMTASKLNNAGVVLSWKGFGPGKSHQGTFGKVTPMLDLTTDGVLTGKVDIDMTTLTVEPGQLQTHLNSADFFDTAKYPTATFVADSKTSTKEMIKGSLTLHGVTKNISFPVTMKDGAYVSDFRLNLEEFGIKQKFANSEIELMVSVPVNK